MLREKHVSNFWIANRGWAWQVFSHLLPSSSLLKMASISLIEANQSVDQLVWGDEPHGVYTVKGTYRKTHFQNSDGVDWMEKSLETKSSTTNSNFPMVTLTWQIVV